MLLPRVNLQDGCPLYLVRQGDLDFTVEAPGPQEGRVEHLGTVRSSHDDDAGGGVEAVHLCEQLVQRLLPLVVGDDRAAALLTDGVDLVDEDDRRSPLVGIRERSRTRDAPTPTNISTKLEPVRAKKGTSASPATARAMSVLPLPGGPTMSTPFGPIGTGLGVTAGVLQEVDDLAHLAFRALVACDVGKTGCGPLLVVDLRLVATDTHDPAQPDCRRALPAQPHEEADEEQEGEEGQEVGHKLELDPTPVTET